MYTSISTIVLEYLCHEIIYKLYLKDIVYILRAELNNICSSSCPVLVASWGPQLVPSFVSMIQVF